MFISTGKKRWEGIQYAFHKNNIEIDNSIVKEGDYSIEGGYEKTLEILKEKNRPTAIFAANHQTSIGVFKALKENKIKVPEEMAIAAFDGFDGPYREYEFLVEPKITSNVHPSDDMGTTAVDLLHKSIQSKMKNKYIPSKNNVHIVIETKFEPRQSTIGSYPGVNAK